MFKANLSFNTIPENERINMELIFELLAQIGLITFGILDDSKLMSDSVMDGKSIKKRHLIQISRNIILIIIGVSLAASIPALTAISIWFIVPLIMAIISIVVVMIYSNAKYLKLKNRHT